MSKPMRVPDDHQFDASSPVGRYWLVHGVGFTVCRDDGRELGVVEDVVVDQLRQRAEHVIVRRHGLVVRRREVMDPGVVDAVVPASQLFLVESQATPAVGRPRVPRAAAGRAVWRGAAAARPVLGGLLRRLAAALVVVGQRLRRAGIAGVAATSRAARRARREAPRLESWLSARSRTAWRATRTAFRFLGRSGRTAALQLAAFARIAAHVLKELAVLTAVLAVAAWRRAAAALAERRHAPPAVGPTDVEDSDADAPLGRETSGEPPPPAERRRAERGRTASGRRSDR
jgi:hypothetical protein